ncbi:transposase [Bradyrhizobium sp. DASA03005]|uniref:transposase n=1 Tax=Bradyrhizobium sp. SPXBL-02 TaxID=3395912 RepID=UPI003F6FCEE8
MGRGRRWSEEEKAHVLESLSEPRLATATMRRYGLSGSFLVTWQRAFAGSRTKFDAFVKAVVAENKPVASLPTLSGECDSTSDRAPDFTSR